MKFHWTSLKAKALWSITPLALVLLALAGSSTWDRYEALQRMRELGGLIKMSTSIGQLVHEVQKERGLSSGFVSSRGQQFQAELQSQRAATDREVEQVRSLVGSTRGQSTSADQTLAAAVRASQELLPLRRTVDTLASAGPQVADRYTKINAQLLAATRQIAYLPKDVSVARAAQAYSQFLYGKELAGIERAMLMNAFTADSFAPGMYQRFIANAALHQQQMGMFADAAAPAQRAYFGEQMRAPASLLVGQMQAVATSKGTSGSFGVAPATWFKAATERIDLLKLVETRLEADLQTLAAHQQASAERAIAGYVTVTVAGLLAAIAVALAVTTRIVRSIREVMSAAAQIAQGNLSATMRTHAHGGDELTELMASLEQMRAQLAQTVQRIFTVADSVRTGATEIAAGNQNLSERTEEQASSLQETAASMEQLTGTVKQNAENALAANRLAQDAVAVAVQGDAVVAEVVATMGSIDAAAKKMTDILEAIDSIAFQTNILSLNAAVEAARAGEQGRGFAVVAAEVRRLAQRCAAAAKEIKALVSNSEIQAQNGSELAAKAGATMHEVMGSIRQVTSLMGEIASASQEQTRGIEQVNIAITQMDQVTQQNAALVEEAAAATHSMCEQAEGLVHTVSAFKLESSRAAAAASLANVREHVDSRPLLKIPAPRLPSKHAASRHPHARQNGTPSRERASHTAREGEEAGISGSRP